MGTSSSKVARGAASGAARKYPVRAPGAAAVEAGAGRKPPSPPPTSTHSDGATKLKTNGAEQTGTRDPDFTPADFSRRLHEMGIVQPNPTFSPSSTASGNLSPESAIAPLGPLFPSAKHNATLSVLEAQRQLQEEVERDFVAAGRGVPRRFVDVEKLAKAVEMRNGGVPDADVERQLRLQPGLLSRLGPPGVLTCIA